MFLIISNLHSKDIEILNEIKSVRSWVPVDYSVWVHLILENEMFDMLKNIGLIHADKQSDFVTSFS